MSWLYIKYVGQVDNSDVSVSSLASSYHMDIILICI